MYNKLYYLSVIQTVIIIVNATGMAMPPAAPADASSVVGQTPLEHPELQPMHDDDSSSKRRRSSEKFREYNLGRIMGDSANIIRRMHGRNLGKRHPLPPIESLKNAHRLPSSHVSLSSSDDEIRNHSFHNQSIFLPNIGTLQCDDDHIPNIHANINDTASGIPVLAVNNLTGKSVPGTSSLMRVRNTGFAMRAMLTFLLLVGLMASIPLIYRHLIYE